MSRKNASFAADLAAGINLPEDGAPAPRRPGLGSNVLTGRENRLAELAAGSVVSRTHELVDPARCRMWAGHNREYALLNEERCADLIESIKAQGRQEMPAIVRRVRGEPDFDFEVICGARRHWSISWLRSHNYPDFRFLVDINAEFPLETCRWCGPVGDQFQIGIPAHSWWRWQVSNGNSSLRW